MFLTVAQAIRTKPRMSDRSGLLPLTARLPIGNPPGRAQELGDLVYFEIEERHVRHRHAHVVNSMTVVFNLADYLPPDAWFPDIYSVFPPGLT
jgi:hypothetical protein